MGQAYDYWQDQPGSSPRCLWVLLSLAYTRLSTLSPFATPLIVGTAVAGHGPLPTLSTLIVALYQSLARPAAHDPSSTLRMLRRPLSRVSATLNSTEHHPPHSCTRTIGAYSTSPLPSTTAMPGDQGDHHATKPTPHCKQLLRCSWTASPPPKDGFTPPSRSGKTLPL